MSSCTLLTHILSRRKGAGLWHFPEATAWVLFKQLLSGVRYLHENQTIHHNLTLDNLLYDAEEEKIVIKGFSLAEVVARVPKQGFESSKTLLLDSSFASRMPRKPVPTRKYINPYFTAPEMLSSKVDPSYDLSSIQVKGKVDVYSCGVILVSYSLKPTHTNSNQYLPSSPY
jgi:serine/threonine protein kinase